MSAAWDAVIPAGGTISAEYARALGTPVRALAPLGPERRPVMQIVVDALRASDAVRRIVGIAADSVSERITGVDAWLPAGDSGPDNIRRGLLALNRPDVPALVCTSDLPLLTPDAVHDFVARCEPGADVHIGLVSASVYETAFPGAPPSQWVALRDAGPVTVGCLFGVRPELLERHASLLDQVFSARKSQAGMVKLLGPRLLWQWATKSLTLAALQARGADVLSCRVQVLRDVDPVLAFDIDDAGDYGFADARLQERPRDDSAGLV